MKINFFVVVLFFLSGCLKKDRPSEFVAPPRELSVAAKREPMLVNLHALVIDSDNKIKDIRKMNISEKEKKERIMKIMEKYKQDSGNLIHANK
jgi:hypothetical protein